MEGESHHYDLRSRSRSRTRSRTPMIFNQNLVDFESNEHHYDLRSQGNGERSHTPVEVSSSRRSESRSLPSSVIKKDLSLERILEKKDNIQEGEVIVEYESLNENSALSTVKKVERRSERRRVKRQMFVNGQGELEESKLSKKFNKNLSQKTITTSDYYSSEGGEFDDSSRNPRSAYEIYKQAGDWWDVFPKTDYTYSQTSQCRYEIAPGILAMPNMSRTSIHLKCGSACSSLTFSQSDLTQMSQCISKSSSDYLDRDTTDTIKQNRLNEESAYSFSRNLTRNSDSNVTYRQTQAENSRNRNSIYHENSRNQFDSFSQIDSSTELNQVLPSESNSIQKRTITLWFEKVKNILTLLFVNMFQFIGIKMLQRNTNASHNYRRYQESTWSKLWKNMNKVFQYLYLLLIRVLFLDSWILRSASTISESFHRHRSKFFWFILPLLLFIAGYWFYPSVKNYELPLFTTTAFSKYLANKSSFTAAIDPVKKVDFNVNNAMEERISQQIEKLIYRVEKLEAKQVDSEGQLLNNSQFIAKLKVDEKEVWNIYEKKISDLEEKITNTQHIVQQQNKESENTFDEIKNIKAEFNNLRNLYADLRIYCNNNVAINDYELEKRIAQTLSSFFDSGILRDEVNKIISSSVIASPNDKKLDHKDSMAVNCENSPDKCSFTEEHIKKIVTEILKTYDADKTGRVDYALESAGGQIISIRCTQSYNVNTRAFKVLGFTLFYESSDPRTVIQGHSLQPGVCWAFQDFPGHLLIKLRSPIRVTGFTVEHAPKSILPNNEIKSAPKKFNVWGLKEENDSDPVLFGEYEFLDNDESLQYFPVKNHDVIEPHEFIELRIHSNHGQLEYTCLYRFRVHGKLI
ncbi:klaroid protein-like [Microplitis mediator]|uniref:klaroid protein-like n=1 Tax=Microplitis mediator TaxID=375433 RepID=UPI00255546B3|nr:klaroid protein-like [Microplitis mediator]